MKEEIKACCNRYKFVPERQISCEVSLDAPDTPFTIVAVANQAGQETSFTLSVFCNDNDLTFTQLPDQPKPDA